MNLLFSIDDHYTTQLATVLLSIKVSTPAQRFEVYVIQKQPLQNGDQLAAFCQRLGMTYHPVMVKNEMFKDAPVTDRYPTTIYYRLLAHKLLPTDLHKILYLDADVLCINDLAQLYATRTTRLMWSMPWPVLS